MTPVMKEVFKAVAGAIAMAVLYLLGQLADHDDSPPPPPHS